MPARTRTKTTSSSNGQRAKNGRGASASASANGARKKRSPAAAAKKKRTASSPGLTRPVTPDAKLAAVVGTRPLPRTQVVKKVWDYVKAEGLQDKKNRRMINADDKLRPLFGGKRQVSMFDMAKMISTHVH